MNTLIQSKSIDENIVFTLTKICRLTNFVYGEAWIPILDKDILELSPNYYIAPFTEKFCYSKPEFMTSIQQFWLCSQEFVISKGEGLPGRVFSSQKPEWILDITAKSEDYFLRNKIAKAFGITTGFAIPVIADAKILMILAFFTLDKREKQPQLIEIAMKEAHKLAKIKTNTR